MNNKTKGTIAGVAGVALLAGGSTFALWRDSAEATGGTITAGNLQVALVNDTTWQDVSDDRLDNPDPIENLDKFRIIPGDTIQRTFDIDAALEGDNMLADLSFTVAGRSMDEAELLAGLDVTYSVLDGDGAEIVDGEGTGIPGLTGVDLNELSVLRLRSEDNTAEADSILPTLPPVLGELDELVDFTVVVTVNFPSERIIEGQEYVQAMAQLDGLDVRLEQHRPETDGDGA